MTADPRVEAVAEALHASEHAGEMTRSCPAWDDAAIAVAALDAYDRKHPIFADATHYAAVETDLRERIAQEIEAAHRTAPDCCAYDIAARIARGQA